MLSVSALLNLLWLDMHHLQSPVLTAPTLRQACHCFL